MSKFLSTQDSSSITPRDEGLISFFQGLPIKPLAYFPSARPPHLLLYNCHSLRTFRLSLANIRYKDIFLHIDKIHFNLDEFKQYNTDPKVYLKWIETCCKRRSFLYSCSASDYEPLLPSILSSFTSTKERRLLSEAYCLLIESRLYDSLEFPTLEDHPSCLIQQLSPDIRIDTKRVRLPRDVVNLFEKILNRV